MMPQKQHRYARPCLEIEYDQERLLTIACCGFVLVVLRVCNIDPRVRLDISFQRVRKPHTEGTDPDAYEVNVPSHRYRVQHTSLRSDYHEYHASFLARSHPQETGTIHLHMESAVGSPLVDVSFRFDPRQDRPILTTSKGQLQALRFLPALRSPEARDALHGQYPVSAGARMVPVSDPFVPHPTRTGTQVLSLFDRDA